MEGLALRLLELLALALGQPVGFFEDKMDHHMSALRLIHYYPLGDAASEEPKRVIRAGAHTDYGALTILNAGQPGLQVLRHDTENRSRTEWYSVPLVPGAFVINLGDLMQRWTNGMYFPGPFHVFPLLGNPYACRVAWNSLFHQTNGYRLFIELS
jgi:isopenicillin N synthase-like dioxygenase